MNSAIRWEDAYQTVIPLINADGILTWDFDPALPVKIRYYAYDRRRDYRVCRHDYFELFYLHSGRLLFQIGERLFPMNKGDLILVNSTQYHTVRGVSENSGRAAINGVVLYFMPEVVLAPEAGGEGLEYLTPFLQQDATFPHVVPAETGAAREILEWMHRIAGELPALTPRSRLTVKTYLKMILIRLVNHYAFYEGTRESFAQNQRSIERLRPLFRYLDEHYSEPISLVQAARIVNMSTSHFVHFMKKLTGLTFVAYLNQFRLSKAQALLAATDRSIADVAQAVGFCDQSYFGYLFRKLLKMTPREYRLHAQLSRQG
jgi:AraC-like DNA-binding protein